MYIEELISSTILLIVVIVFPELRRAFFLLPPHRQNSIIFLQQRVEFFDFIKGIAILAVIIIHVVYFFEKFYPENNFFFLNLLNNINRFAVPIFFIVSGILLHELFQRKKDIINFYRKKIVRIFIPFLLVNLAIAVYKSYTLREFLYNLITGQAALPYYFIIILGQFYLLYPFFVKWRNKKWFLPLSFLVSVIFYLFPYISFLGEFPFFGKFIFFFAYGIAKRDDFLFYKKQTGKQLMPWLLIVGLYFVIFFTYPGYYYNIRFFFALAVFYLLFYFKDQFKAHRYFSRIVVAFGQNSLWIYITHFLVVFIIFFLLLPLSIPYYVFFALMTLASIILSFIFAHLCRAIYTYFKNLLIYLKYKKNPPSLRIFFDLTPSQ